MLLLLLQVECSVCLLGAPRKLRTIFDVWLLPMRLVASVERVTGLAGQEGVARAHAAAGVLCNLGIHARAGQQPRVERPARRCCCCAAVIMVTVPKANAMIHWRTTAC